VFDLVDLKKYRRYEVIMTAYNIIGESPASVPVEVFVGEAGKLQASPLSSSLTRAIRINQIASRSIDTYVTVRALKRNDLFWYPVSIH
jgi:hypothetical protein